MITGWKVLAAACMAACACSGAPGSAADPAGTASPAQTASSPETRLRPHQDLPPAVFKDARGVRIEVASIEVPTGSPAQALLRITGVAHPLTGNVLLATQEGNDQWFSWNVDFDGGRRAVLQTRIAAQTIVNLHLPRLHDAIPVEHDPAASKQLDPLRMIADHQRQKRAGDLARLEQVDREYHEKEILRWLNRADAMIDESCQTDVNVMIDVQNYSDEEIVEGDRCADALEVVASICSRDIASRRKLLAKIDKIVCEHKQQFSIGIDAQRVLRLDLPAKTGVRDKVIFAELRTLLELTNTVVRDSEGRVLTFDPDKDTENNSIYIGDGKTMRRLPPRVNGQTRSAWGPIKDSVLHFGNDGWTVDCPNDRAVLFRPVDDKTRLEVLTQATYLEEPLWQRREFALARDDRGIYYYVDRIAKEFGGQGYRVFRGPRGQVEETTLTDIVDDSDGMIFATKAGKLRLILGKQNDEEALWIEGKKQRKLVVLPLYGNRSLIYNGLGAYDGEQFGTICE